jgi:hypothetical protein
VAHMEVTGNRPFGSSVEQPTKRPVLSSFARKLVFETEQPTNSRQVRDSSPQFSSIRTERVEAGTTF